MELRNRVESEKNYVDPSTVFKGLDYYRFLMKSLLPASIPGINLPIRVKLFDKANKCESFFFQKCSIHVSSP